MKLVLHVSPQGHDSWNGFHARANPDRTDGPLATLDGALRAARLMRQQNTISGPIAVQVAAGHYRLRSPLRLGPADSGLHFRAEGEVILDGTVPVTGWEGCEVNGVAAWKADVRHLTAGRPMPRSLFVNGRRCPRPRFPRDGWLVIEDVPDHRGTFGLFDAAASRFVVPEGAFDPAWRNPSAIEAIVNHLWVEERMPVESYDPLTRLLSSTHRSIFSLRNLGWMGDTPCAKFHFENVFEALRSPGEWYFDAGDSSLYYLPRPGEIPGSTLVELPLLRQLVRVHGVTDANEPVRDVHFEGFTFKGTDWLPSEGWGKWWDPETPPHLWRPRDSFSHFDQSDLARTGLPPTDHVASVPQAAHDLPGVVSYESARDCSLTDCTLLGLGFYAIDVRYGCEGLRFEGNLIEDVGGGGVKIDGAGAAGDNRMRTRRIHVGDNTIQSCGRVFPASVGVLVCHADHCVIEHNAIRDLFYTAISVGWTWSYAENPSRGHLIQFNDICGIGQGRLSDMGGIYTLGVQPGTIIRGNRIREVRGSHYGGWGIYLDQASSFITVEGNLVHHTNSQCFNEHWGRQNVVRDNIFALSASECVQLCREESENSVVYPPKGCLFLRNILVTRGRAVFKDSMNYFGAGILDSDLNLFWDVEQSDEPLYCAFTPWPGVVGVHGDREMSLRDARALGLELHSLAADPGFANPEAGDFSVSPSSPVRALGMRLFDPLRRGPRPASGRVVTGDPSFRAAGTVTFAD